MEALSNVAAYTAGYAGNELGLPMPITMILSLGLGVSIGKMGSKFVVKSKSGVIVGEILDKTTGDKSLATNVKAVLAAGKAEEAKVLEIARVAKLNETRKAVEIKVISDTKFDRVKFDEIVSTTNGLRPEPSTYLSKEYIQQHLNNDS